MRFVGKNHAAMCMHDPHQEVGHNCKHKRKASDAPRRVAATRLNRWPAPLMRLFCLPHLFRANEDYNGLHSDLGIAGRSSRLGNDRCFVKESNSDADTAGSMAKCVEAYQQDAQGGYCIFILVMCPFQMIAAYVGWVLPDLYFAAHHQAKEDEALQRHAKVASKSFESEPAETAENPVAEKSGGKDK